MKILGKTLGGLLIVVGLILQLIMPLGLWNLSAQTLAAMPAELAIVLIGTLLIALGILLVYLSWFRHYAEALDRKVNAMESRA